LFFNIEIDEKRDINVSDSYVREESKYLCKSKKTMLIFRRMS